MSIRILILLFIVVFPGTTLSQMQRKGISDFPELNFSDIPGAPKLNVPILLSGISLPIIGEGHGLASPAFWDWDGDGLKDLLIGEFGTGRENNRYVGNFIRVFKNQGNENAPQFDGSFDYGRPPTGSLIQQDLLEYARIPGQPNSGANLHSPNNSMRLSMGHLQIY